MTETAERLQISQPAVSYAIARLEGAAGQTLIDRKLRPASVTPAGLRLYERARRLLADAAAALGEARDPTRGRLPSLRVAVTESAAEIFDTLLADGLLDIAGRWSFRTGVTRDANEALTGRDVDLIVTAETRAGGPRLESRLLLSEPFFVVAPKAAAGAVSLADLARRLPLIAYSQRLRSGQIIANHLKRLRLQHDVAIEYETNASVLARVNAGAGWAIVSGLAFMSTRSDLSNTVPAAVEPLAIRRSIYLVARPDELGAAPEELARRIRLVLETVYKPRFAALAPALAASFEVPKDADPG